MQVYAVAGGAYGEIWGTKYQRVEEGEFKGQLLLLSLIHIYGRIKSIWMLQDVMTGLLHWYMPIVQVITHTSILPYQVHG